MKKFIIMLAAMLLAVSLVPWGESYGITANDIRWGQDVTSNMPSNTLKQWTVSVESLLGIGAAGGIGTGNKYYVDSNVTVEGDGSSWTKARNTLDEAVALCTANNGDVIYVAQGHNESLTAADGVDLDVAGITVIGCGSGSDRPRFDFDNAAGEFVIGAAAVTVINLTFLPSVTAVTHCIDVENAGDWAVIAGCEFLEGEAAGTDEFIDCIQVGTTATNVTIRHNVYTNIGGTGPNNFIDLSAATISNPRIYGNVIKGEFAEAGIWGGAAVPTDVVCFSNYVENRTTGQFGIEFQGAATGIYGDNQVYTDGATTAIDPGSMKAVAPNWIVTAIDKSPIMFPARDDGATNLIGVDDADNLASTSNVASNRDGSILERLEFLNKYFETGTPGALVAPANTMSLLDILGSDGSTTTGAVAGSLLGAIGTNEAASATAFTSSAVEDDADGSALERLEHLQVDSDAQDSESEWADLGSTLVDNVVAAMDANSTDLAILNDLGGLSQVGDKVQVDMDANSTDLNTLVTDSDAQDTEAEWADLGSTLVDNIVSAMDANSTDLNTLVTDSDAQDSEAEWADLSSTVVDNVVAAMDANSSELNIIKAASLPTKDHPNYFTVDVNLANATWNTAASHEIATVTGACRVQMLIEVTETCVTVGPTGTIALGFEGNASAIFSATGLDSGGTTFTAGDVVSAVYGSAATTPASGANTSTGITGALFDVVVVGGKDIGYTIATNAATDGTLVIHVYWEPLDATGAVVEGAGGAL